MQGDILKLMYAEYIQRVCDRNEGIQNSFWKSRHCKSHSGRDVGLISVKKYKSFIKINFSWFHTLVKPNHQHDAQVL